MMSVLACDRNGCENIMCDRYSHEHGYICNDCFDELVDRQIMVSNFMQTPKRSDVHKNESSYEFYNAIFKIDED